MLRHQLLAFLAPQLTARRWERMQTVAAERTRRLTVVLEDLYQPHNAAACLRSCDCFGIPVVHVVERARRFKPSRTVAMGAHKWLELRMYRAPNNRPQATFDPVGACVANLRGEGYTIVATTPDPAATRLEELPLDEPLALCFGTELTGLSNRLLGEADRRVVLPGYGFTQSFNVSVTVAIVLYDLTRRLRSEMRDWRLPAAEQERLLLRWLKLSLKRRIDGLLDRFCTEEGILREAVDDLDR